THGDDAEVRMQGRERIGGNLRAGCRHRPDQGGFSGVRQAHQPYVGEQLQLELQVPRFARGSLGRLAWRTVDATLEVSVAEPAAPALGHLEPLAGFRQVTDQLAGVDVVHDRAARYDHIEVLAGLPALVTAGTRLPARGTVFPADAEIRERIGAGLCHQAHA